ncbi:MAG: tRNA-dihydrouridine synthase, partial [Thermoactinomyces sp.]
ALGNPWMLYRTVRYLETGELLPEPTAQEKMEIAVLHMDRLVRLRGERIAVREMRKHAAWYLKGLPGASKIKDLVNQQETRDGMAQLLLGFAAEAEAKRQKESA